MNRTASEFAARHPAVLEPKAHCAARATVATWIHRPSVSAADARAVDRRRVRFERLGTSKKPGCLVGWNMSRVAVHVLQRPRNLVEHPFWAHTVARCAR